MAIKDRMKKAKAPKMTEAIMMEEMKPTIYLSDKELSGIKEMDVGQEYEFMIKVKMKSKTLS